MKSYNLNDILDIDFKSNLNEPEELKIFDKLLVERYYASVVADSFEHAQSLMLSTIRDSKDKYIKLIKLYEDELDNILKLDKRIETEVTTEVLGNQTDDEASDSTLVKRNDTPNAANNPDLLTDKYLSESERVSDSIGERKRSTSEEGETYEDRIEVDNIERLRVLGELEFNISNLYDQWLNYIDRRVLVVELTY